MPSSWAPLAHKSGLRTLLIEPVSHLHVAILSRKDDGLHPQEGHFVRAMDSQSSLVVFHPGVL
ncbi:hypothetical protein QFZ57_004318 [Arthrobacter sp. B1I2]|nr:hypothetical protein [Arthrobacter sp. B1I2]